MTTGVVLAGVGGQGTLLAAAILSEGLMRLGYDVKVSEAHGMAQRGGSVVTQLRYGIKVYSPIMAEGEADVLASFEKMEAARHLRFLKPGGLLLVGDAEIPPLKVLSGETEYPGWIEERLRQTVHRTRFIPARDAARKLGSARVQNTVVLGALIHELALPDAGWHDVMRGILPERHHAVNCAALDAGMAL